MLHVAELGSHIMEAGLVPEQQLPKHRLQLLLSAVASAVRHGSVQIGAPSTTLVRRLPVHVEIYICPGADRRTLIIKQSSVVPTCPDQQLPSLKLFQEGRRGLYCHQRLTES